MFLEVSTAVQTLPLCVPVPVCQHMSGLSPRSLLPNHVLSAVTIPTVPPCPSLVLYFRQIHPDLPNIIENVLVPHWRERQDIMQHRGKKAKSWHQQVGREVWSFVSGVVHNCVWESPKKSNDHQALDRPTCSGDGGGGENVVSGGWYDCKAGVLFRESVPEWCYMGKE